MEAACAAAKMHPGAGRNGRRATVIFTVIFAYGV
jgi:hypothetical protein